MAATTRVTTMYLNGSVPDTCMASICSVTRIDESSAPMPEPTLPAQMTAVMMGPISRTIDTATIAGSQDSAPNWASVGRDWMVRTSPMMNPVMPTRARDLLPIRYDCFRNSLISYGG